MPKLFRLETTLIVYVAAETQEDAEAEAGYAFREEVRDNAPDSESSYEISSIEAVEEEWLDVLPRGDDHEGKTCRQIVEANIEAARLAKLAAPTRGQASFTFADPEDPSRPAGVE